MSSEYPDEIVDKAAEAVFEVMCADTPYEWREVATRDGFEDWANQIRAAAVGVLDTLNLRVEEEWGVINHYGREVASYGRQDAEWSVDHGTVPGPVIKRVTVNGGIALPWEKVEEGEES